MSINKSFSIKFIILALSYVACVLPLLGQDMPNHKRHELGVTFGNVLNKNNEIGIGPKFSIMYHNWNSSNRAIRIGLSYGANNKWSSLPVYYDQRNNIREEFNYFKKKDIVAFSLGHLFQKMLYPKLGIYLAYDIHLGLVHNTVSEYYQKNQYNINSYIYAKTKDEKYIGGLLQVMPAAGLKWRVFKELVFTTELAIFPMIVEVDKTVEFGFNPYLQAHIGLSYRF